MRYVKLVLCLISHHTFEVMFFSPQNKSNPKLYTYSFKRGNFRPMNMYLLFKKKTTKLNTKRDHKHIRSMNQYLFFLEVWEDKMSSSTMKIVLIYIRYVYMCVLLAECMLVQQSSLEEVFNKIQKSLISVSTFSFYFLWKYKMCCASMRFYVLFF